MTKKKSLFALKTHGIKVLYVLVCWSVCVCGALVEFISYQLKEIKKKKKTDIVIYLNFYHDGRIFRKTWK